MNGDFRVARVYLCASTEEQYLSRQASIIDEANAAGILDRKQLNVVSGLLRQWCTNVMRSKVEPMRKVAQMIRDHFEGIVA